MALRVGVFWYRVEEQECLHVHIYVHIDPGLWLHLYAKQQTLCLVTQTLQQWLPIIYRQKMTKCQLCKELCADKQTSLCRFLSVKLQYQRQGSFILENWANFFPSFSPQHLHCLNRRFQSFISSLMLHKVQITFIVDEIKYAISSQLKDSLKKCDFGYLNCLLSSLKKFIRKGGKTLFKKSAGKFQVKFLI